MNTTWACGSFTVPDGMMCKATIAVNIGTPEKGPVKPLGVPRESAAHLSIEKKEK